MPPSLTSSQPPRPSHAPCPSSPPQEKGGRRSPGSTLEMPEPLAEGTRVPQMPLSRRERQIRMIENIVSTMRQGLSEAQNENLDKAVKAAKEIFEATPLTVFMSLVDYDFMPGFRDAYQALQAELQAELDLARKTVEALGPAISKGDKTKLELAAKGAENSLTPKVDFLLSLEGRMLEMAAAKFAEIEAERK